MTNLLKSQRNELNALSKNVFGSTSRWQKLVDTGYEELITEEVTETVPATKEGGEPTTQKVQAPVLKNGSRQYVTKRHTVESIKEYMLKTKEQIDLINEQIAKQKEEARLKKETEEKAKELHSQLSGSVK